MLKYGNRLYIILLSLILVTASIPVFCMYIIDGGIVGQWISLIQEQAQIGFTLFSDLDYAVENGFSSLALNSNLFYFLPALFLRLSGNIRWTWVIMLFLIQLGSMGGAVLLYCYMFPDKTGSLCGILLYMTMPFRIYLCYDKADISQAFIWMFLPYYFWSILHILDDRKRYAHILLSIVFLAATGYANAAVFPVIAGLTLLIGLIKRNVFIPVTVLGGTVLALPGLTRFLQFLFDGEMSTLYVSYESIMTKGYSAGELLSCFIYADDKPGIGAGLLLVIILLAWNKFVSNRSVLEKEDITWLALGILFLICSLRHFPWDLVQRVHPVLLKMVALFQTPGLFLYFACFLLAMPCARTMSELYKGNDKYTRVFLVATLFILCLGTTIYECNTYIFSRFPLAI